MNRQARPLNQSLGNDPQPSFETTARTMYMVKRLQHETYLRMDEVLQPLGVTVAQYTVLSLLGHRDGLSSAQLSRRYAVTPQTMIKLITHLETKGVISRAEAETNRRVLVVSLTVEGRKLLAECEQAIDRVEAAMFGTLSRTETAQFRQMIVRVLGKPR